MNPSTGEFHPIGNDDDLRSVTQEEARNWPRFSVGEEVSVNGVRMRIKKITRKDLVLRPVQQEILRALVQANPKKQKSYNRSK